MSNSILSLRAFAAMAFFSSVVMTGPALAGQGGCGGPSNSKDVPLSGLWEISSYREIHGDKSYMVPGDYVVVYPTTVPGEACVEFTRPIEGSLTYYLAMNSDGTIIDDAVISPSGLELRVLIEKHVGGISVVLYATGDSNIPGTEDNGDDNGGALANGGRS
ncbi:MAG: hypothetical protein KDI37_00840 [Xanthomonadales bacterium]|nr:hypothetical protein [Xanthomonadales bacterium]MCB1640248.1 hypothetical protein [Xanthomonadales bacterium]